MIIRAASSSSDDDDESDAHGALQRDLLFAHDDETPRHASSSSSSSVFPSSVPSSSSGKAHLSATTAVKTAWLAAIVAMIALLAAELAATLNLLFPTEAGAFARPRRDLFSPLALVIALTQAGGGGADIGLAAVMNNTIGLVFVSIWVYSREANMAVQRRRSIVSKRHPALPASVLKTLPWSVHVVLFALGHIGSCLYILLALFESHGSTVKFWLGRSSNHRTPHV